MDKQAWATEAGTAGYRGSFSTRAAENHFRQQQGLWMSSIGLGTYLGAHDDATDALYRQAVVRAVELGVNVIDSAINYRFQRSERSVGAALKELESKGIDRRQIVIATKGGFIPFDGAPPTDVRSYFDETFIKPGVADFTDIVGGCHCMTPRYLLNQIDGSLTNLGLDCIDIYYVHNPEMQLGEVSQDDFGPRLEKAFEALEGAVEEGKIRMYGTATWNAYRVDRGGKDYLSLAEVEKIARRAGGDDHHFKVIQLPFNLGMPEALIKKNQPLHGETLTTLEAAEQLGLTVMCSASVLQGQLTRNLPERIGSVFEGLPNDAQRSLQFVRSAPGVTSALVGMKQIAHVEDNLSLVQVPPAPWEQFAKIFTVQGKTTS